jgi:hypothetical protein
MSQYNTQKLANVMLAHAKTCRSVNNNVYSSLFNKSNKSEKMPFSAMLSLD